MSNAATLLTLLTEGRALLRRAQTRLDWAERLKLEGRDALTQEEWDGVLARDDEAAARQQAAIDAGDSP
jgi:hypothetical protein